MKKLFNKVFVSTIILATLAGCAGEEDTIIVAPVPLVASKFTPTTSWSSSIGDGVEHYFSKLTPAYAYDKLFIASRDGIVKALEPSNGKEIWKASFNKKVSARFSGGIATAYRKIYLGSENGFVIALNEDTGEEVWRAQVDGEVLAAPIADNNLIIVNTSRGMLIALEQETGEQKWVINTEVPTLTLRGDSRPIATSGGIFWGTANGRLAAAIVEQGQLIWQQPVGMPKGATEIDRLIDVDSSPIIIGDMLYTIGLNGQLIAIDLRSGKAVWKRNYSSATDMMNEGNVLFIVTDKDHVVAVDARSGTEIWNNKRLEHRQLTAPVLIKGYVVLGDSEGYLHWMDRKTGYFIAQQLVDKSGFSVAPIVTSEGYIVTTRNGKIKKMTIDNN